MTFNPDIHHRKTIRLREYDYSQAGFYFITICTQDRMPLFGNVVDGAMVLNDAGNMVKTVWDDMPTHYPDVVLDEFVVMPNHVHGIVNVTAGINTRAPTRGAPTGNDEPTVGVPLVGTLNNQLGALNNQIGTLNHVCEMVGAFKSLTTVEYIRGVNENHWPCFPGRLWQRNYWERIIRHDRELHDTREYIRNNPAQWMLDDLYM